LLGDARTVLAHADNRFRRLAGYIGNEIIPVQTAIIATDQDGDIITAKALQSRHAGIRRGTDGIVDVTDAFALTDGLQSMRQWPKRLRVRCQ